MSHNEADANNRRGDTASDGSESMAEGEPRGRKAEAPQQMPLKAWRDIVLRIKDGIDNDNLSVVSAGVAFYALLAAFPGLAALISIYGLIIDPQQVATQLTELSDVLPADARELIRGQLREIASAGDATLGFGLALSVAFALWSIANGMKAMFSALNIVYDEREERGFIKLTLLGLAAALMAVTGTMLALGLIAVLPPLLEYIGFGQITQSIVQTLRWPLLALAAMCALSLLYRYGPSRRAPKWRWVTWGATTASVLWLAASGLFSWYVAEFGTYNETYGAIGAVIVLILWFYLTAFLALLGAEINSELEHQTRVDSTVGRDRPMGERGAHVADTLGRIP